MKDLKSEIVEAFINVATKDGIENVTLQRVAKVAKVAYSTVHYHFGTRALDMVSAGFERVGQSSQEFIERGLFKILADTERSSLGAYIDMKFSWQDTHRNYASMWIYFLYMTTRSKTHRQQNTMAYNMGVERIKALLIQDIGKGYLRPFNNSSDLAGRIEQALAGGLILAITTDVATPQAKKETRQNIEAILGALVQKPLW